MQVVGTARALALSPTAFRRIALASAVSLYAIIVSGAAVRLTASGLGCESWPGCEPGSFFPASSHHAYVEFGNRVVALFPITLTLAAGLGARRTPGLPAWVAAVALATFLGTVGQAPLGLLTIRSGLHPLMVMAHFLLALVVLAGGIAVAMEAWRLERGRAAPVAPAPVRRAGLVVVAACAALVVTGALATAAGPHPGGADVGRLGRLDEAMWVHVRTSAVFGVLLLALVAYLAVRRAVAPRVFRLALAVLALAVVQGAIGEAQWRMELPWELVLVHVALAAAVFSLTVLLAYALWRPPRPLAT